MTCLHFPRIYTYVMYIDTQEEQNNLEQLKQSFVQAVEENDVLEISKIAQAFIDREYVLPGMFQQILFERCKSIEAMQYITNVLKNQNSDLKTWQDLSLFDKSQAVYYIAQNGGAINVAKYILKHNVVKIASVATVALASVSYYMFK